MPETLPTRTRFFIYTVFAFLFTWITIVEAIIDEGESLSELTFLSFSLFIIFTITFILAGKLARILRVRLKLWPYWVKSIYPRFTIDFILVMLQTFVVVLFLKYLLQAISTETNLSQYFYTEQWLLYSFPFVIFSIVWLVEGGLDLFSQRQNLLLQNQRLEKEHLASKLQSLKNQLRPHFLFNHLNTISNLVYKDAEKADFFTQKLASIYRYVLDVNDEVVTTLSKELNFINDYIALQQIRFEDKLIFENHIRKEDLHKLVPPLSIELLVENAIKHNIITTEKPLRVSLETSQGFLIVRNTYQPKEGHATPSKKGLNNLKKRLELLGEKYFKIEIDEKDFIVRFSMIEPES